MKKLKVAILIDNIEVERYKVEIINELLNSKFCDIVGYIKRDRGDECLKDRRYLVYRLFNKIEKRFLARGVKYIDLKSIQIEEFLEESCDLIINLSSSTEHYENSAKYGMWQFVYRSYPIGFWEVIEDKPYTEVFLQKSGLGFEPALVLDYFRTNTDRKSTIKNMAQIVWRSHMMVVRNVERLAKEGDSYFKNRESKINFYYKNIDSKKRFFDLQFSFNDDKKESLPTNLTALKALCKLSLKYVKFTIRKFFKMDRWLILYAQNRDGKITSDLTQYKRFYAPSIDYFVADPFVVDEGDKSYLFYEELDYSTLKGYLKVAEFDEKSGEFTNSKVILKEDYHLSYPNVFKYNGIYYMIPESYENRSVDLYEAVEFPVKWKKIKTLLSDLSAVDATLYFDDNRWWMFVNIAPKDGLSMNDELYIYYCKDFLTDEWTPHSKNPVVCDVVRARSAGNLIKIGDKLYRPAQDCSGFYGRKVVINEILRLDENEYKERVAGEIDSSFSDDLVAVHTLNSSKRFTVIDAIKSR